jgi:hypothetical protein
MEMTLGIGVNGGLIAASAAAFAGVYRIQSAVDSPRPSVVKNLTI